MTMEISRGIVKAHRAGIVTSTSLLGNCTDLDGARALLAEAPALGVGVHLALIGGRPVSDAGTLPTLTGAGPPPPPPRRGRHFFAAPPRLLPALDARPPRRRGDRPRDRRPDRPRAR